MPEIQKHHLSRREYGLRRTVKAVVETLYFFAGYLKWFMAGDQMADRLIVGEDGELCMSFG